MIAGQRRQWHPTPVLLLENPMDRGAWQAAVHGVTKSRTRLSDWATSLFTFMHWRRKWQSLFQCSCLENPRDRGAWWAAVHGVTQSCTWLKRLGSSSSSDSWESGHFLLPPEGRDQDNWTQHCINGWCSIPTSWINKHPFNHWLPKLSVHRNPL